MLLAPPPFCSQLFFFLSVHLVNANQLFPKYMYLLCTILLAHFIKVFMVSLFPTVYRPFLSFLSLVGLFKAFAIYGSNCLHFL
jgi:hypothetical protein